MPPKNQQILHQIASTPRTFWHNNGDELGCPMRRARKHTQLAIVSIRIVCLASVTLEMMAAAFWCKAGVDEFCMFMEERAEVDSDLARAMKISAIEAYLSTDGQYFLATNKRTNISALFILCAVGYKSIEHDNTAYSGHRKITPLGCVVFGLQLIAFLAIPQMICNVLGLTFFNTFPGEIKIKKKPDTSIVTNGLNEGSVSTVQNGLEGKYNVNFESGENDIKIQHSTPTSVPAPAPPASATYPNICFRVVTKGCYPELVQSNVRTNFLTCVEAGLTNFSIEVVTDIDINITSNDPRVKQIVVPESYESSTKARFKARALQYALEPGKSDVQDDDYIVHLDEETIISRNVVYGIVNFALNGKHAFGQGMITYTNLGIVNIFTTLADSFRVARDLGDIRFALAALHKPIFGIKGSFVVTRCGAEKDVSFDHGEDGSIAEDCYFSMIAYQKGYTFDFIMGEMFEKSPFTMLDLIKQRKRWLQGIWLVVGSPEIHCKTKFFLAVSFYAWLSLPLTSLSLLGMFTEVPFIYYMKPIFSINFSCSVYMYLFGLIKSLEFKKHSFGVAFLYIIIQLLFISLSFLIENTVVIWAAFSKKHNFYIVQKQVITKPSSSQADSDVIANS